MGEFRDSFILIWFIHTGHSDVCDVFAGGYAVTRLLCFHYVAELFVLDSTQMPQMLANEIWNWLRGGGGGGGKQVDASVK